MKALIASRAAGVALTQPDHRQLAAMRDRYSLLCGERARTADVLARLAISDDENPSPLRKAVGASYTSLNREAEALFARIVTHPAYRQSRENERRRARKRAAAR